MKPFQSNLLISPQLSIIRNLFVMAKIQRASKGLRKGFIMSNLAHTHLFCKRWTTPNLPVFPLALKELDFKETRNNGNSAANLVLY